MDKYSEMIFSLSEKEGVSGFEGEAARFAAEVLRKYTKEITIDPLGNVRGLIPSGRPGGRKILLDAHIDEIGLIVQRVEKNGFLRFLAVGGVDPKILPGAAVTVLARQRLQGIIAVLPPHLKKEGEDKSPPSIADMVIDIGYSYEGAKELVQPGDEIVLSGRPKALLGQRIIGKALDDRAGLAVIFYALDKVWGRLSHINIEVMASVQEEIGTWGAMTGGYLSGADLAIVIDAGHGKTPDAPEGRAYELGGGVMIGVGPNMRPDISKRLVFLAEREKIPYQIEVMGGNTGTNAWALQIVKGAIGCGLLSIPVRYMHTPSESLCMKDFYATGDLLAAFLLDLDKMEEMTKGDGCFE